MNEIIKIFEQIMEKFAFRQPVPPEAKKAAQKNKRNTLNLTLKYHGDYSLLYNLILRIYFFFKKSGFGISVIQAKVILYILSFLFINIIAAGIFLLAYTAPLNNNIIINDNISNIRNKPAINTITEKDKPSGQIEIIKDEGKQLKKETVFISSRLGIEKFSGEADDKLLNETTDDFERRLTDLLGKERIVDLRIGKKEKNINRILTGSIEKLGKNYIITVKILNVENSKVDFLITEDAQSLEQLKTAYMGIIDKTADQLK